MSETKPRPTIPPPAWALAGRWSAWIGVAQAAALLAARAAVTYRFGGQVFTAHFAALVAAAEIAALAAWPMLAAFARTPPRAAMVGSTLQWAAVLLLGLYLVFCVGAVGGDDALKPLAALVARDVVGGAR